MAAGGLSPINKALNSVPKRAEARQAEQLRDTFVDSGVAAALEAVDHQVLYGRRGTGKTHAFRYLETLVGERGDISFYADLRTIGSPEGLFAGDQVPATERAARLLVDLLGQLHDTILSAVVEDDALIADEAFIRKVDALAGAITTVRLSGEVEVSREGEEQASEKSGGVLGAILGTGGPKVEAKVTADHGEETRELIRETRRGTERFSLNFSQVARAIRELAGSLSGRRIWFLLDEWSSVPPEIQGGFKWSSQRLIGRGCDGQASWVDDRVDGSGAVEVAGEAVASTGCGAVVLA